MREQLLNDYLIKRAYQVAKEHHEDLLLVGGAIRDLYLKGSVSKNLDFLLKINPEIIARTFAREIQGSFFCIDRVNRNYRVMVTRSDSHYSVDFSLISQGDITLDLLQRDFTINSVALPLDALFEKGEFLPIDPAGGLNDLKKKQIRASSPASFKNDPVRILRAIRFSRDLNLSFESQTLQYLKESSSHLPSCSWERIRNEFFKILAVPNTMVSLIDLDQLGILTILIPEITPMKGLSQGAHHDYELWEHTLQTVNCAETILQNLPHYFPRYTEQLTTHFQEVCESEVTRKELLLFTALLHDSGKPHTRIIRNGQIHFYGHEQVGQTINQHIARRFKLGKKSTHTISTATGQHLRLLHLHHLRIMNSRIKYRFFKELGDTALDTLILILADKMATRKGGEHPLPFSPIGTLVGEFMDYYFQEYLPGSPSSLLTGNDVMKLMGIGPGKEVGKLLALVARAEREGKITTPEEAIHFITSSKLLDEYPVKGKEESE